MSVGPKNDMDPMFDETQLDPSIEFTKTTLDV